MPDILLSGIRLKMSCRKSEFDFDLALNFSWWRDSLMSRTYQFGTGTKIT